MRPYSTLVLAIIALTSFGGPHSFEPPAYGAEAPVAAEKNPPGDIPDSQVFVTYSSPLGFVIKAPEGWSRRERSDGVRFADKYGSVDVSISAAAGPVTPESVKAREAPAMEQGGHAVKISSISAVKLPAGSAVLIKYTSNSEANDVTGKKIRLERDRYLVVASGKLATIDFSAPAGADNVDQWKLMSESFGWK